MDGEPVGALLSFQPSGWRSPPTDPLNWSPPLLLTMLITSDMPIGADASTPPVFTCVSSMASVLRPVLLML